MDDLQEEIKDSLSQVINMFHRGGARGEWGTAGSKGGRERERELGQLVKEILTQSPDSTLGKMKKHVLGQLQQYFARLRPAPLQGEGEGGFLGIGEAVDIVRKKRDEQLRQETKKKQKQKKGRGKKGKEKE